MQNLLQLDGPMCDIGDCAVHYGSQYKEDGNADVSGTSLK
jgi:hypothetical protein